MARYHSHKWTVYIRSISNEDLGLVIKRVVFTLHPSFNNPTRVVDSAPFELSETGWGEFEIGITIIFHGDAAEKPIELYVMCFLSYPCDHLSMSKVSFIQYISVQVSPPKVISR